MGEHAQLPSYIRQGCLNHLHDMQGYKQVRNIVLEPGHVVNEAVAGPGISNLHHGVHGGFLMYLIDVTGCMAGYSCGKHNVTLSVSISFLHALKLQDKLTVEATMMHNGRSTGLAEVRIFDSQGRLCTTGSVHLFFTAPVEEGEPVPCVLLEEMYEDMP